MAILIDTMNCTVGTAGTYFNGCKVTLKDITKIMLISPSVNVDLQTDKFDDEAISLLIKKNQLVVLSDILQVTDSAAKNNYQTLANKTRVFISQGLYDLTVDFEYSPCLTKALHKLVKRNWELLLIDSEGKMFFDNRNGKLKGFDNNMSVNNPTLSDGGSKAAMVSLDIQLSPSGTTGFNERASYMTSDEVDFLSLNGIQDVTLQPDGLSVANLKVKVLAGCDNSTPIEGLATADFKVTNQTSGAVETVTVQDLGNGEYKITGATAGAVTIQLWDSVNNLPVTDIDGVQFFQSNVLSEVLTA